MTRPHLGRHTDAETGHAPICTRELGGPLCAAPAAWHVIWPGGDGGMACEEHGAEARSLGPRQIHRLARGACGLPGSLWVESERRCVLDVADTCGAAEGRTALRKPIDWERVTRTLIDAVRRARRSDPEEYETHA